MEKFVPVIRRKALADKVLVVARTRIEGAWAAYIDAVPGIDHETEMAPVLSYGNKIDERIARILFSEFKDLPYAS